MDGETRRLIDFERVEAVRDSKIFVAPGDPLPFDLVVAGIKPRSDMEVTLEVEEGSEEFLRTGYLGYQVVGSASGTAPDEPVPYEVSTSLGSLEGKGVLVVGASVSRAIEVPPGGAVPGTCHDWVALRRREPGVVSLLYVAGHCAFPTAGYAVGLERREPPDAGSVVLDRVVRAPASPVTGRDGTVLAVYRETEDPGAGTEPDAVKIMPEGIDIPIEDVDEIGFLDAIMQRSLSR